MIKSRITELVRTSHLSSIQVGRVFSKLGKMDSRIKLSVYKHTNQYLLPPQRDFDIYPTDSDDKPPLIA